MIHVRTSCAEAGATIAKDSVGAVKDADIVLCVGRPEAAVVTALKKGAVVAGIMDPYGDKKPLEALTHITTVA